MNSSSMAPKGSAAQKAAFASDSMSGSLVTYEAIQVADTVIRKVWFEARGLEDARAFASAKGFGLQGERARSAPSVSALAEPVGAFNAADTCRQLGGISRTSLYRLLVRGKLSRLKDTRKVLVTRRSIDRYLNSSS